jgi:hypothetical protein
MANTNYDVAHIWANQSRESAKSNNGNFYFNGPVLYSYGSHYPVAIHLNNGKIAFNKTSSSMTTESKHKNAALRAIGYSSENLIYLRSYMMEILAEKALYPDYSIMNDTKNRVIDKAMGRAREYCKSALKRRKESLRDSDFASAIKELESLCFFLKYMGFKPGKKILNFMESIRFDKDSIAEKLAKELEKERKQKAKENKERKERQEQALYEQALKDNENYDNFRNGLPFSYFDMNRTFLLRIKDLETIETSGKAKFPIEHGKLAWKMILACKTTGKTFQTNGQKILLGDFKIDSIDSNGNVIAGCHRVDFKEIQNMARLLGLINE